MSNNLQIKNLQIETIVPATGDDHLVDAHRRHTNQFPFHAAVTP